MIIKIKMRSGIKVKMQLKWRAKRRKAEEGKNMEKKEKDRGKEEMKKG